MVEMSLSRPQAARGDAGAVSGAGPHKIFALVLLPLWADEQARLRKNMECSIQKGRFNRVRDSDLFLLIRRGSGGQVVAVCEAAGIASPGSDPEKLRDTVHPSTWQELCEYLEGSTAKPKYFEYVMMRRSWDARSLGLTVDGVCAAIGADSMRRGYGPRMDVVSDTDAARAALLSLLGECPCHVRATVGPPDSGATGAAVSPTRKRPRLSSGTL